MRASLPPGPRAPRIVQALGFFRRPIPYLEACRRRYGDVFSLRMPLFGRMVYVTEPSLIKTVFTGDPAVLHAGEVNSLMEPVLGPNSVLLLDDEPHMRQRRVLLPPFHGEAVKRYGELMAEITAAEVERWPVGEPFALRPRMQAITLEVILRTVFGIREADRLARLRELLPRLIDMTESPFAWIPAIRRDLGPWSPWGKFKRLRAEVDSIIYDEIERRRGELDGSERDDVMSLLLRAEHEDGQPMSDRELRDELMTLLGAGHETTATALAWAFERLVRNPEAMARLVEDVDSGDGSYLEATIKETLRVRPVILDVGRKLKADFELGGYSIPEDVMLVPAIAVVQRRPEIYPEPDRFRPERFLEGEPESYSWIPFGGGVRRCLGASFALYEMRIVLRAILERVELGAARPEPERIRIRNVTLTPAKGAEVVLVAKRLEAVEDLGQVAEVGAVVEDRVKV